ncbi:MAG: glucose-1-phosphate adenylyltransferase subunit GlgD [Clostridiales bacterium]|jgi:glucose-1-phosphate adenylyltransferase|nr:glucose-1-phosphate adenylyltransferase subunit GlgD [Clostridiales bacterium]
MKAIGIILAGGKSERLRELTAIRATSAMPVGSCYRVIDFHLSCMASSGINKIAVITQYNSRSLHDHLSSSKWWDLGRKQGGLFVFSPFQNDSNLWFRGTADSIFQNIAFLKRSNEPYVVISSGNCIFKMDFNELIAYHAASKADITVLARETEGTELDVRDYGVLGLDDDQNITDFEEKPIETDRTVISLGMYVMPRLLLIKILENISAEGRYDFVNDVIIRYRKKLKINAFMFGGYWTPINSVPLYFKANMDFLRKDVRDALLADTPYIETKPKDEPPAKFNYLTETRNCLFGSGSILNGTALNSVIFRKVFTGENSFINNSIIMEGCYIGNNCRVEHVIMDKDVILSDGKNLIGTAEEPVIVKKGAVI